MTADLPPGTPPHLTTISEVEDLMTQTPTRTAWIVAVVAIIIALGAAVTPYGISNIPAAHAQESSSPAGPA